MLELMPRVAFAMHSQLAQSSVTLTMWSLCLQSLVCSLAACSLVCQEPKRPWKFPLQIRQARHMHNKLRIVSLRMYHSTSILQVDTRALHGRLSAEEIF